MAGVISPGGIWPASSSSNCIESDHRDLIALIVMINDRRSLFMIFHSMQINLERPQKVEWEWERERDREKGLIIALIVSTIGPFFIVIHSAERSIWSI